MTIKVFFSIIILFISVYAADAAAGEPAAQEIKAVAIGEGYALGGLVAAIERDEQGHFFMRPSEQLADKIGKVEKDTPLPILEGPGLEIIKSVYDGQSPLTLKLWGLLTVYQKANYAYINYVLPVTAAPEPAQQETQSTPVAQSGDIIPQDVLRRLKGGASIDTGSITKFEAQKKDAIYADRTGFIQIDKDGQYIFVPDGLGRNIETEKLYLLKCQALESVAGAAPRDFLMARYKVAGITCEFEGKKYLLLQRCARAYGYGNLSEF